jgi:hypothetical protein
MSTEIKPAVSLGVILTTPLSDVQKAYMICLEVAKTHEKEITFQGIWIWSLTNPNRDAQIMSFVTDADLMNEIITQVKSKLNLQENVLYNIVPFTRPSKPTPMIST